MNNILEFLSKDGNWYSAYNNLYDWITINSSFRTHFFYKI